MENTPDNGMEEIFKEIENSGRSTDNIVGHLTAGEIVIPTSLAEIPEIKATIEEVFASYGVDINEFTVGNEANKINPTTGYPEFFFGKVFKAVKNFFSPPKKEEPKPQPRPQSQPQQQPQNKPATPSGGTPAQANKQIADDQAARAAAASEDARKKAEQTRFEQVSKAEGEKRRKEYESKAGSAATKVTGGETFLKKEKGADTGVARTTRPAAVSVMSPATVQNTILGLPANSQVFTKFGESINKAANLTYSNPQARVGGM